MTVKGPKGRCKCSALFVAACQCSVPDPFALFGTIHGHIRHLQQFFASLPVAGVESDADASADGEFPFLKPHRLLDRFHEFAQYLEDVVFIAYAGKEDSEFVAAETGNDVAGAHGAHEPFGDEFEGLVADVVAEGVVDDFKPVEVEEDDGQHFLAAPRLGEGDRQLVAQHDSVGQAGQRVVVGEVFYRLFVAFAFGDVDDLGDEVARPTPGVAHEGYVDGDMDYFAVLAQVAFFHDEPFLSAADQVADHEHVLGQVFGVGYAGEVHDAELVDRISQYVRHGRVYPRKPAFEVGDDHADGGAVEHQPETFLALPQSGRRRIMAVLAARELTIHIANPTLSP